MVTAVIRHMPVFIATAGRRDKEPVGAQARVRHTVKARRSSPRPPPFSGIGTAPGVMLIARRMVWIPPGIAVRERARARVCPSHLTGGRFGFRGHRSWSSAGAGRDAAVSAAGQVHDCEHILLNYVR